MEIDLNTLVSNDLRPDEYVYLYCIKNPPKNPFRMAVNVGDLKLRGWADINIHTSKVELTDKAVELLTGNSSAYVQAVNKAAKDVVNWVEDYRKLFPAKNPASRLLRGSKISCVKRLQSFIKEYSTVNNILTKDLIINATKMYLSKEAKNRYMYTKAADYFIYKGNKSDSLLLSYITSIQENGMDELVSNGDMTDDI